MTDEEKAEEYLEKHKEITHIKGIYHLTINEKQAYLDGLAEGRKESAKDIDVLTKKIEQLKCDLYNTNANLQHITIEDEKEITELKEHVEQLSNDNHILKTSYLIQREQIEKMKTLFEIIKNRSCTIDIYNIAVEGMEIAE